MKNKLLFFVFVLPFFYSFAQTVPSYLPTNGLVSYWGFENTTNDYTSNNNDGTIVGSSNYVVDRFGNVGNSYSFVSGSDIVCTTNSFNNIQVFSTSIWFKTQNEGFLFGLDSGQCIHGGQWDRYTFINASGNLVLYAFNGSEQFCITTGNYKDNNWHNVVSVLSSDGMKVYIDGVLSAQNNSVTSAENYIGYWRVGGLQSGGNNTMIGNIDDIGVWDRVLTPTEILHIYQQGSLSVNEQKLINFKIYPNPTIDKLIVENLDFSFDDEYVIVDLIGKEIMNGKLDKETSIINVSSLSKGVYILSIKGEVNRVFKFVKN
ncbi:LamG-like jellyroll fold domain-containing protein [Flavobacterium tibetense]|nr:LamG-like jellyroll fold domain-containing protein [Flavobacterium tibetense]